MHPSRIFYSVGGGAGGLTVATNLLTESESLFSVSVINDQLVAVGTQFESDALFVAGVITGQSVTTGLLSESDSLFLASVVPGSIQSLTGLLAESDTLFTPTLIQGQSAAAGLLTESDLLFSPAILPGGTVVFAGLVAESESLLSTTAQTGDIVVAGLVSESESLFTPALIAGSIQALTGLVSESESLIPVSVITGNQVLVGLVSEAELLASPLASGGVFSVGVNTVLEQENLFALIQTAVIYGGTYNITAKFTSGQTDVVISLFDPVTYNSVPVDDNKCYEVGTTGLYLWGANKLTSQPAGYQEYVWSMSDGANSDSGLLKLNSNTLQPADSATLQQITTILKIVKNKQYTDPVTGKIVILDDDDITPFLQASIFEDVAGASPYQGNGINRRDKLS